MDTVIYDLSFFAIIFLGFLALKWFDQRLTLLFGLLFAIFLTLSTQVTGLIHISPIFNLIPDRWNWIGKIYQIVFSLLVAFALGMNTKAMGLELPRRNIKPGLIALIPLILVGVVLGYIFKNPAPSGDEIAFQALMPGLGEELAYRGIAPALLLGLIHGRNPPEKTPWIVVCIAAIPFGVLHGLDYSAGVYSFDWIQASYTFAGGVVYCWLRFASGSLLFPVLAHGGANVAFSLMGFIDT